MKPKEKGNHHTIRSTRNDLNLSCKVDGTTSFTGKSKGDEDEELFSIETVFITTASKTASDLPPGEYVFLVSKKTGNVLQCTETGELRCANRNRGLWEGFRLLHGCQTIRHDKIAGIESTRLHHRIESADGAERTFIYVCVHENNGTNHKGWVDKSKLQLTTNLETVLSKAKELRKEEAGKEAKKVVECLVSFLPYAKPLYVRNRFVEELKRFQTVAADFLNSREEAHSLAASHRVLESRHATYIGFQSELKEARRKLQDFICPGTNIQTTKMPVFDLDKFQPLDASRRLNLNDSGFEEKLGQCVRQCNDVGEFFRPETQMFNFPFLFSSKDNQKDGILHAYIAGKAPVDVFKLHHTSALLRYKWRAQGRRRLTKEFAWYSLALASFVAQSLLINSDDCFDPKTRQAQTAVEICLGCVVFLLACKELNKERRQYRSKGGAAYWKDFWNYLDLGTSILLLACELAFVFHMFTSPHACGDESAPTETGAPSIIVLFGVTSVFAWLKILNFLQGYRLTSALVTMIVEIMKDMFAFMIIVIILVLAAANAWYLLLRREEGGTASQAFGTIGSTLFATFNMLILGDFDTAVFDDAAGSAGPVAKVVFMFLQLFVGLILLNLLIAVSCHPGSTSCTWSRQTGSCRALACAACQCPYPCMCMCVCACVRVYVVRRVSATCPQVTCTFAHATDHGWDVQSRCGRKQGCRHHEPSNCHLRARAAGSKPQ